MAANLSAFQKKVLSAVTGYEKGSAKLVRIFEDAVEAYQANHDYQNLQFFINALAKHKVLQKAAVTILKPFCNLKVSGGNGKDYVFENAGKWSPEKKAKAIEKFTAFKAKQYDSFLQETKVEKAFSFVLDDKVKAFENSLKKLLVDAMANGEDSALVITRLQASIKKMAKTDLTDDIEKRKEAIAKLKASESANEENADEPAQAVNE